MITTRKRPLARTLPLVGWRENITLPALGIGPLVAKIDTGARTAAMHAENIVTYGSYVRFVVPVRGQPLQCELPLKGSRRVKSTSGHSQHRVVVETEVRLGSHQITTEITLTDRADMGVPMLLGRVFLRGRFLVHAGRSFIQTRTSGTTS